MKTKKAPVPFNLKKKAKKSTKFTLSNCWSAFCGICRTPFSCICSIRNTFICLALVQGLSLVFVTWCVLYVTGEIVISKADSKHMTHFYDFVETYISHGPQILDQIDREVQEMATPSSLDAFYVNQTCPLFDLACYNNPVFQATWENQTSASLSNILWWKQIISRTLKHYQADVPHLVLKYGSAKNELAMIEDDRSGAFSHLYLMFNGTRKYMRDYYYDLKTDKILNPKYTETKQDPVTRPWYLAGMKNPGKTAWTPINFTNIGWMAILAGKAIIWKNKVMGVASVHFNLYIFQSKLKDYLKEKFERETYLDLYEADGNIVGSTSNPTERFDTSLNAQARISVFDQAMDNSIPARAARDYFKSIQSAISAGREPQYEQTYVVPAFFRNGDIFQFFHFQTTTYRDEYGLFWILAITTRREFFFEYVLSTSIFIFVLFLLLICCCSGVIVVFTSLIVCPLQQSAKKLQKISQLKLGKRIQKKIAKARDKNFKKLTRGVSTNSSVSLGNNSQSIDRMSSTGSNKIHDVQSLKLGTESFMTSNSSKGKYQSDSDNYQSSASGGNKLTKSLERTFKNKCFRAICCFGIGCKCFEGIVDFFRQAGFFYEIWSLNNSIGRLEKAMNFFTKYIPVDVVKNILEKKNLDDLASNLLETRNVSVLFTDIKDFTSFSEQFTNAELLGHLTNYFEVCTKNIETVGGVIDKFIGDAVMAIYNPIEQKKVKKNLKIISSWKEKLSGKNNRKRQRNGPVIDGSDKRIEEESENGNKYVLGIQNLKTAVSENHHATLSVLSAVMMQKDFKKFRKQRKTPFFVRVGISTGNCMVGNIGSNSRLNFTALGDTVNVAARLEPLNKLFDTDIMISGRTMDQQPEIADFFKIVWIDSVYLKGKDQDTDVYAVFGFKKNTQYKFDDYYQSEQMVQASRYPFIDENSEYLVQGAKKGKKTQILEICSNVLQHLFEKNEFQLFKKFVDDIEPYFTVEFSRIIQHWKERAVALCELANSNPSNLDYELFISEAKHLKLTSK